MLQLELEIIDIQGEVIVQFAECETGDAADVQISNISGGSSPYLYALNDSAFSTQNKYTLITGEYQLRVQDINGCEWDTTLTVPSLDSFGIELGDDVFIEKGEEVTLDLQTTRNMVEVLWQSSNKDTFDCRTCRSITVQPNITTTYFVEAIDENGCSDTDQVTIFVSTAKKIYVPTAFSPNNDGVNDEFVIFLKSGTVEAINTFSIFDRWGNLLFQTSNITATNSIRWDGNHKGQTLGAGIYIYTLDLVLDDETTELYSGEVLLVR